MEGSIGLLKEFITSNFGSMNVEEIKDRKIVRVGTALSHQTNSILMKLC